MAWKDKLKKGLRATANFASFGAIDTYEAKGIVKDAKANEHQIKEELNEAKELTQQDLEALGDVKSNIYSTTLNQFVSAYEVIGKVDLSPLKASNQMMSYDNVLNEVIEMKQITVNMKELALVGGGSAVAGATAVCGAMGFAAIVGTASTGTAIGTLSGVAATNATLAWLGGGAISAGGFGMAGGMVVLGGVALAPVAVFGMFLGSNKGKQKLDDAHNYADEVAVLQEKIKTLIAELSQIRRGCYLMTESLKGLDGVMSVYITKMNQVIYRLNNRPAISKYIIDPIKKNIFRMSLFSEEESQIFCDSVNCASMLKQLIDKPLMNEEGGFMSDVLVYLEAQKTQIDTMINQTNPQLLQAS
jgi:hypothetical protein